MYGFNWVDLVLLILLFVSIKTGYKLGALNQVIIISVSLTSLFIGGALIHRILPIDDRTILTIVNTNLVLIFSIYATFKGYDYSVWLHNKIKFSWFRKHENFDSRCGVVVSIIGSLLGIWLVGGGISRLPFVGLTNSVHDSLIVRSLHKVMPFAPNVYSTFNNQLDPNLEPYVFNDILENPMSYNQSDYKEAAGKATKSIVKITSFGCGGIVSGSGFVVADQVVMTNAHVIAGISRPVVVLKEVNFEAYPIYFNSQYDVALLRIKPQVHSFDATPMILAEENEINTNQTVSVAGYPAGNLGVTYGVIQELLNTSSRNIYDMGVVPRNIYVLQTYVKQGSSGGPVVLPSGKVAGMIFSRSTKFSNYAFAQKSDQLKEIILYESNNTRRVGTGYCFSD